MALGLGVLHGGAAQHASRPQSALATLESSWLTLTLTLNPNQAEAIFGSVAAAQSMRLANAIDWRG